jgi:hypothetical protein
MNTAIPPTVAGAKPLSRRSRLLSMVDKNLVADKGPSVLVPVSIAWDRAHFAVASSFAIRRMVGAA